MRILYLAPWSQVCNGMQAKRKDLLDPTVFCKFSSQAEFKAPQFQFMSPLTLQMWGMWTGDGNFDADVLDSSGTPQEK